MALRAEGQQVQVGRASHRHCLDPVTESQQCEDKTERTKRQPILIEFIPVFHQKDHVCPVCVLPVSLSI